MAGPIFRLEEQLSDLRSNQIAYRLTIENPNEAPMRLLSLDPQVPAGATLIDVINTTLAKANARKAALLEELNSLLKEFLWATSEDFRQLRNRQALREFFSISGIFRLYLDVAFRTNNVQSDLWRNLRALSFKMESRKDAEAAYTRWMRNSKEQGKVRSLFSAKVEQLRHVEDTMTDEERYGLATIDAKSSFTATYVLRFRRGHLEPRKYKVGFEAVFASTDGTQKQSTAAATSVQISPHPLNLTLVAMVSAVLGAFLRSYLAQGESHDLLSLLTALGSTGEAIVGPILALIFFNLYEYTSLGKGISMPVSWRSALLIGTLCGVAQDRVLAALQALIGG